ncbi:WD repeat-containing protein 44-like isoform X2 [Tigriopus californicus]|uniref:WD repeat-containing protein 44-like isoform X2 n=1 Tax=Tigriopus californicus TaxID=6832 RepID=UPI0027DA8FB6|nr:WD repeat-containing protein 44-like isoform X2 [Tigriopus californicus]
MSSSSSGRPLGMSEDVEAGHARDLRVESGSSSSDEFYDAMDQTPGRKSRGSSLKRGLGLTGPIITITSGSPSSSKEMTFDGAAKRKSSFSSSVPNSNTYPGSKPALPNFSSSSNNPMVLPEEIARELEEISKTDAERRRRLARLQKLQQEDRDDYSDFGDDEDIPSSAAAMRDDESLVEGSTESSVDGVYVEQKSHPFKVIEPDTRSTASETRSGRIYASDMGAISREASNRAEEESLAMHLASTSCRDGLKEDTTLVHSKSSVVVPDIVSSIQADFSASAGSSTKPLSSSSSTATVSKVSDEFSASAPSRPPRKKRQSLSQFLSPTSIEPPPSNPSPPNRQHLLLRPHSIPSADPPFIHENNDSPALSPIIRPSTLITSTPTTRLPGGNTPTEERGSKPLLQAAHHAPHVLPSPASTVESLTRDFENSLLRQQLLQQQQQQQQQQHQQQQHQNSLSLLAAMRGQYVVRPQDNEESRAARFSHEDLGSRLPTTPGAIDELSPTSGAISKFYPPKISREESYHSLHSPPLSSSFSDQPTVVASTINPPERGASGRKGSMGSRRSFKSMISGSGGSAGRRSSSSGGNGGMPVPGVGIMGPGSSLGSSKGGSGGKRSSMGVGASSSMESGPGSISNQMNSLLLRTKSDSGQRYSEDDIMKQIKVKNLDTGEEMDLMQAEDQLPTSINPLSLHIMRLTSEYVSGDMHSKDSDSDSESLMSSVSGHTIGSKKKKSTMKRLFGDALKKTSDAARSLASEATRRKSQQKDTLASTSSAKDMEKLGRLSTDINSPRDGGKNQTFKRIQAHKSGPFDFENIQFAQELATQHLGPIWCMRFSQCGQLLATAGKDTVLRIWVLKNSYDYFKDMRTRYNTDGQKSSPTNSYDVIADQDALFNTEDKRYHVFNERPFCSYQGHTSDVLDICWSKNYFILTSSMDKTVRLWHISRRECLCCFQHIDFVTALAFHPRNDQFFLSGSLDGKLRLWNIPDKKVTLWNEVDGNTKIITAANFIQNGKFAVAGTYDGRCIFYSTDQLKYYTMIHVRSTRGKNSQGRKVTGIEPMPGEDKILVTSNDSRIRIYDLRDLSLTCKFKGYTNNSSQIRATFSHDGKYVTSGSENQCVFLWRTQHESTNLTSRKDRNSFYEAIKAHNAVVTCSVFAPNPPRILDQIQRNTDEESPEPTSENSGTSGGTLKASKEMSASRDPPQGYVLVSADYDGDVNVFYIFSKPKHSSLPSSAILGAKSSN